MSCQIRKKSGEKIGNVVCCIIGERHHYRFRLYALDATFNLAAGAERDEVIEAIEGHILEYADYTGTYTSFS